MPDGEKRNMRKERDCSERLEAPTPCQSELYNREDNCAMPKYTCAIRAVLLFSLAPLLSSTSPTNAVANGRDHPFRLHFLLRLKGGQSQNVRHRAGMQTEEMELDHEEKETLVKSRMQSDSKISQLVLKEPNPVKRDRVVVDDYQELKKYHIHANKIVKERPMSARKSKAEGSTRVSLKTKMRSPDAPVLKRASVNCTLAIKHGLFNASDLATYLKQRIKYNGKLHNYDDAIEVRVEGHDVTVLAYKPTQMKKKRVWSRKAFSTRYIRYLTKKFICKIELKDIIRPVSVDFSKASQEKGGTGVRFEIRYTNIHKNKYHKLKYNAKHGTRLEMARSNLLASAFDVNDADKLDVPRKEMYMERKIKATGERIGGEEYLKRTRRTIAEEKERKGALLKHWVELQEKSYRAPFGGAMEDWKDTSILNYLVGGGRLDCVLYRHDPDRLGKGSKAHSTAGYTATWSMRNKLGVRAGVASLLYTGIAPDGFKSIQKRAAAQRLKDRSFVHAFRNSRTYSKLGEGDRTIHNWKPKWLLSGKMDLHKRDWR